MVVFIVFVLLIISLFIYIVSIYNRYVRFDTENLNAFSNISVFLQKRLDLIPNLVETVKGYANFESKTLKDVIEARNNMTKINLNDIDNIEEIKKAESVLSSTLKSIIMLQESYPNLKADTSFLNLQSELNKIETEIERARRYYNQTVTDLNKFTRIFPNVLFKNLFGFRNATLFEAEENAKQNIKVEF